MNEPVQPQPFPREDLLAGNVNRALLELKKQIDDAEGLAYSYVMKSVRISPDELFEHHGSGPNFQGGRLTLCTCKHQMRTSLGCADWKGTWVAGFTSRCLKDGRHWLFYLTRIAEAHESHADLWDRLLAPARRKKSAQENFLGDVFAPRAKVAGDGRFDPRRYHTPSGHSHRRDSCDNGWHNDIDYWCADRYGHPPLLVGDPHVTFIWEKPIIRFSADHCRNFKKWDSIGKLLRHLI